jgi:hypothetical protein
VGEALKLECATNELQKVGGYYGLINLIVDNDGKGFKYENEMGYGLKIHSFSR